MLRNRDNPISLISFGEILWDVIDGDAHLGGAALNLAAHASRLGMNSHLISRVGDDEYGRRALIEAAALGVDVSDVLVDPTYSTGKVIVKITGGQPEYKIQGPAAWDFIETPKRTYWNDSDDNRHAFCFGTLAQRNTVSRNALKALIGQTLGAPTFYDVNLRQDYYSPEIIEWSFHHATVVKVNDSESAVISELLFGITLSCQDFAERLVDSYGVAVVLVTLGPQGCLVSSSSGTSRVPGHHVAVVDTVGAGDAFSAGFLSAWLRGKSPLEAAMIGNTLGAYIATMRGAVPDYSHELIMRLSDLGAPC